MTPRFHQRGRNNWHSSGPDRHYARPLENETGNLMLWLGLAALLASIAFLLWIDSF